jgi:Amt family ammonium transporter
LEISLIDTLWVLVASCLVFFMNAGFALVEAGFCRAKNTVNILGKNFVVFAIASLMFWLIGYGLMFGEGNALIGLSGFMVNSNTINPATNIPVLAFFFFQSAFAAAGASIVSGAVAERIKFDSFLVFTTILIGLIYPFVGHWIWGGGWLSSIGFMDFAGSTAVHSVGGWAALMGIIVLGPRLDKFRIDGSVKPLLGHSIPLATLGGFILWLGWFGFNAGSTLTVDESVAHIFVTTALAACAGVISSLIVVMKQSGKADLSMIINGALAGLVAITAGCNVISPGMSIIVGAIAGVIVVYSVQVVDKIKLDDPVGAVSVHLVNGIWGTIAVGLFAVNDGLFMGGGVKLLIIQIFGIIAVGFTVSVLSYLLWTLLSNTMGIRVTEKEELEGLDIGEMGMEGYNGFQIFTTEN